MLEDPAVAFVFAAINAVGSVTVAGRMPGHMNVLLAEAAKTCD